MIPYTLFSIHSINTLLACSFILLTLSSSSSPLSSDSRSNILDMGMNHYHCPFPLNSGHFCFQHHSVHHSHPPPCPILDLAHLQLQLFQTLNFFTGLKKVTPQDSFIEQNQISSPQVVFQPEPLYLYTVDVLLRGIVASGRLNKAVGGFLPL